MAQSNVNMSKLKRSFQMLAAKIPQRTICEQLHMGRGVLNRYKTLADSQGLSYGVIGRMSDGEIEFFLYDKNNIMRSEWKSIIEDQNFRRMLLRSTSHNDNYFFRPLSQSLRFLLFSQDLSVSRLGVRSVYAFSNASRFALESARA